MIAEMAICQQAGQTKTEQRSLKTRFQCPVKTHSSQMAPLAILNYRCITVVNKLKWEAIQLAKQMGGFWTIKTYCTVKGKGGVGGGEGQRPTLKVDATAGQQIMEQSLW